MGKLLGALKKNRLLVCTIFSIPQCSPMYPVYTTLWKLATKCIGKKVRTILANQFFSAGVIFVADSVPCAGRGRAVG